MAKIFSEEVQSIHSEGGLVSLQPHISSSYVELRSTTGSTNTTSATFQYRPSSGTLLSRRVEVSAKIEVTVEGVKAGFDGNKGDAESFAKDCVLRDFPLNNYIESCNVKLNGYSKASDCVQNRKMFRRLDTSPEIRSRLSCCTQPDYYATADKAHGNLVTGPFGAEDYNVEETRRMHTQRNVESIVYNGSTPPVATDPCVFKVVLKYEVPFHEFFSQDKSDCFANLRDFEMTLRFKQNEPESLFIRLSDGADRVIKSSTFSDITVRLLTIQPPASYTAPPMQIIRFQDPQIWRKSLGVIAIAGTDKIPLDQISASAIPSAILIMIDNAVETRELNNPLQIKSVNLRIGSNNGILANAKQEDLIMMSQMAGMSPEFGRRFKDAGNIVALRVGEDFGIPDGTPPGSSQQFLLSGEVEYLNNTGVAYNNAIVTVAMLFDTSLRLSLNHTDSMLSVDDQSHQENMNSGVIVRAEKADGLSGMMKGGSFFKDFGKTLGKALHIVSDVTKPVTGLLTAMAPGPLKVPLMAGTAALGLGDKLVNGKGLTLQELQQQQMRGSGRLLS